MIPTLGHFSGSSYFCSMEVYHLKGCSLQFIFINLLEYGRRNLSP